MAKEEQEGFVRLKVTMEVEYFVPIHKGEVTKVNGWTIDEVKQDWFEDHNINGYHCARDASLIGGSKVIKSIEVIK